MPPGLKIVALKILRVTGIVAKFLSSKKSDLVRYTKLSGLNKFQNK